MSQTTQYQNWRVEKDADNILWLYFDRAGRSTNSISFAVLDELEHILNHLPQARALIITSVKANGFIAGADIEIFTKLNNPAEVAAFINKGQSVFKQLAGLSIPTIALIRGFCLGGGLELALSCRYRIAEDSQKTKLGLPEVLLGLHPGWGGSVRLPRLIGSIQAFDLILTGRTVSAKAAYKMGFVDVAVPERYFMQTARYYALNVPASRKANYLQQLTNHSLVRPLLAKQMRSKLRAKLSPEHYPAPFAVVDIWEQNGVGDLTLALEAESLARIALTETAKNLIRVFFLQDRLKGLSKGTDFKAKHVHVIGAGTMGGDIAAWCALRGLTVTLQDREPRFIAPAIKRAADLLNKKLKEPRLVQAALDRLMPDLEATGIRKADVIIEAIYEDLAAKQAIFKMIEAICKPDAILATNTSSIPLDEINRVLQKPERLVGIHFFNPVAKMQLVEIVKSKVSLQENIDKAIAFVRQIDRLPLPVKSSPGFLVNRVLMPYLMEAMMMLEEGISKEAIDHAAIQFGMPMGPIELSDTVGLDVCLAVAKNLSTYFGGTISTRLEQMVSEKALGRKIGQGFYQYKDGKPVREFNAGAQTNTEEIIDRLILRMLNESVTCLREQVVADNDLLDAGMVLGTGFAPFRGGPLNYAKTRGVDVVVQQLNIFAEKFGVRFKADAGWNEINK